MKTLNRRACGLLRAATIEAQISQKKPSPIGDFPPHDRRKYGQPTVKTIKLTLDELDRYLTEQSKHWGQPLTPLGLLPKSMSPNKE